MTNKHAHLPIVIACLVLALALGASCKREADKQTPPDELAAKEKPKADKPLKLFDNQMSRRWKSVEAYEAAEERALSIAKKNSAMPKPNRPDPQGGKAIDIKAALSGMKGQGPLTASFNTSIGLIQCELDAKNAEKGVAHFVSLARGLRAWWSGADGKWSKTPYYSGRRFYRVYKGKAAFAGCPTGAGSGEIGVRTLVLEPGAKPTLVDVAYPLVVLLGGQQVAAGPQIAFFKDLPDSGSPPHYPIGSCVQSRETLDKLMQERTIESGYPINELIIKNVTFSRQSVGAL